jgi:hypothetical protein
MKPVRMLYVTYSPSAVVEILGIREIEILAVLVL